ncbi:flagellar basal body rod protein FlgB [Hydrogenimonas urashimensis]|uniref:flagellar basal body rod protein FlgB n=1 Tax=Hydrogenimonas urashimensis TaxID=2740515 RepID=UPI001916B5C0|nr:flagellar basal body rod protein FlgB [Hydrogenimonas urashimensis]
MQISRVHGLLEKALDYRAMRQDMISSNIANVDTPNYRARDISFESLLAEKSDELFAHSPKRLEMRLTNENHIGTAREKESKRAEIFFRDGHTARNDGNTVDLDIETTEMAKNTVVYNALVAALKKDSAIFRSVLDASAKT